MKRKFLSGLLVITMGMALLAGCGGSVSTNDEVDKNAESAEKNEAFSYEMTGEAESTISTKPVAEAQKVEVSLQDFLESPTITGIPWKEATFEDICTMYGLSEENGYWYENLEEDPEKYVSVSDYATYNPEDESRTEGKRINFTTDGEDEDEFNFANLYFMQDEAGNMTLEEMSSEFCINHPYREASQAEVNWLEAHCGYLKDRNAFTMEDILLLWNMDNADLKMVEAAKNFSSYEGSYTTEYGETVFLLEHGETILTSGPFSRMTVTFNDEDCPYEEVIVGIDYASDEQGNIPLLVGVTVRLRGSL